ncbi:MAG: hypothetical protein QXI58_03650 [Candidatus Micrarchaeia archaeon]
MENFKNEEKIEIEVLRSGMLQKVEFIVKETITPVGKYKVLYTDRIINFSECVRIANKYNIPVETPSGLFFPLGKKSTDFIGNK